jgi:hypothetical protein
MHPINNSLARAFHIESLRSAFLWISPHRSGVSASGLDLYADGYTCQPGTNIVQLHRDELASPLILLILARHQNSNRRTAHLFGAKLMMHYTIEGSRVLRCNITDAIVYGLVTNEKYVYVIAVAHIRLLDGVAQAGLAIEALVSFRGISNWMHLRGNRSDVWMGYKQYRECNDRLQLKNLCSEAVDLTQGMINR